VEGEGGGTAFFGVFPIKKFSFCRIVAKKKNFQPKTPKYPVPPPSPSTQLNSYIYINILDIYTVVITEKERVLLIILIIKILF
jgi:hypothetical protein